jgi:transglutaminase superfamily protein/uncharacterized protein DUF3857
MKLLANLILLIISTLSLCNSQAQSETVAEDDYNEAAYLKKKFKDDAYAALKMTQHYSFEKGKNDLQQPVVKVKEEGMVEFIALKDIAVFQYAQFHNQFVNLESFYRYDKYQKKYVQSGKRGVDRSVTDDNVFFDDSRMQFYSFRFFEKGRMAKITWEKEYTDGKYLTRNFFYENFPVVEKQIEFEVPSWLDISFIEKNFGKKLVTKTVASSGKNTVYSFEIKNAPATKQESNAIALAFTDPHILIQLKSFEDKGQQIKLFQKTSDLYDWYSQLYRKSANDLSKLKPQVTSLIADKKTDEDKIKAIYYWVQDNIRYIAYEDGYSGYVPSTAQEVFTEKYGDCKGMANLLTEMLKIAGYDAHFTWIGTRRIPYDHSVPVMCVDNHAITTLFFKGREYFLDGTEKYAAFGENAFRIQGKSALIEKGEKFDEKIVPASPAIENKIRTTATLNLSNGLLKGHVKIILTGNEKRAFHNDYQDMPKYLREDFLKDMVEFGNSNLTATNVKSSDLNDRNIPAEVDGDIDLTNNITDIGNNEYLSIDFFPTNLKNYLPTEKRTRGYDFQSVFSYEDEIELSLPAGRKFTDLPPSLAIENNRYAFSGSYELAGNKVKLKKTLTIKDNIIPAEELNNWKNFLDQIKEFNSYLLTVTK